MTIEEFWQGRYSPAGIHVCLHQAAPILGMGIIQWECRPPPHWKK